MYSIISREFWKRLGIGLTLMVCFGCYGFNPVEAQDPNDPIGSAKLFPPYLLKNSTNEFHLDAIGWELKQQTALLDIYLNSKQQLSVQFEETNHQLRQLNNQLPPEVRFVNPEVRSRLIGKAMEELLNAKLDLATREKSVELQEERLVESRGNSHSQLLRQQSMLEIESAKMMVDIAAEQLARIKELTNSGVVTNAEHKKAQYELAIARQELAATELRAQVAGGKNKSEIAKQLTDARLAVEPVKARIEAIDRFLKQFSDSADVVSEIEQAQRQLELWRSDYDLVVKELIRINRDVEEMGVLKSQIDKAMKAMEKKKAPESEH